MKVSEKTKGVVLMIMVLIIAVFYLICNCDFNENIDFKLNFNGIGLKQIILLVIFHFVNLFLLLKFVKINFKETLKQINQKSENLQKVIKYSMFPKLNMIFWIIVILNVTISIFVTKYSKEQKEQNIFILKILFNTNKLYSFTFSILMIFLRESSFILINANLVITCLFQYFNNVSLQSSTNEIIQMFAILNILNYFIKNKMNKVEQLKNINKTTIKDNDIINNSDFFLSLSQLDENFIVLKKNNLNGMLTFDLIFSSDSFKKEFIENLNINLNENNSSSFISEFLPLFNVIHLDNLDNQNNNNNNNNSNLIDLLNLNDSFSTFTQLRITNKRYFTKSYPIKLKNVTNEKNNDSDYILTFKELPILIQNPNILQEHAFKIENLLFSTTLHELLNPLSVLESNLNAIKPSFKENFNENYKNFKISISNIKNFCNNIDFNLKSQLDRKSNYDEAEQINISTILKKIVKKYNKLNNNNNIFIVDNVYSRKNIFILSSETDFSLFIESLILFFFKNSINAIINIDLLISYEKKNCSISFKVENFDKNRLILSNLEHFLENIDDTNILEKHDVYCVFLRNFKMFQKALKFECSLKSFSEDNSMIELKLTFPNIINFKTFVYDISKNEENYSKKLDEFPDILNKEPSNSAQTHSRKLKFNKLNGYESNHEVVFTEIIKETPESIFNDYKKANTTFVKEQNRPNLKNVIFRLRDSDKQITERIDSKKHVSSKSDNYSNSHAYSSHKEDEIRTMKRPHTKESSKLVKSSRFNVFIDSSDDSSDTDNSVIHNDIGKSSSHFNSSRRKLFLEDKNKKIFSISVVNKIPDFYQVNDLKLKMKLDCNCAEILVVDDDMLIRQSITNMLVHMDKTCLTAENGKEAFNIIKKVNMKPKLCCHKHIKIVFLDIHMPIMNGIALGNKLKNVYDEFFYKDFKIVVISANSPTQYLSEFQDNPLFYEYLKKPVNKRDISRILADIEFLK